MFNSKKIKALEARIHALEARLDGHGPRAERYSAVGVIRARDAEPSLEDIKTAFKQSYEYVGVSEAFWWRFKS